MFKRALSLPTNQNHSFFLWGQRKAGKTTLLKQSFSRAYWIDLLHTEELRKFASHPETLREELRTISPDTWVVIDEIQKIPPLLDEVHSLIEGRRLRFALSGSSARKLKRGHANLLGGRALRFELYGLNWAELGRDFDLNRMLNSGYLPDHFLSSNVSRLLQSYVADYLKEEILAEALVKNLTPFSDFLHLAALSDTEKINFSTFARDVGVSSHTAKEYFEILCDTLLGFWLPAYTKKPKRRISKAPKFFFSDVGTVNVLAKRRQLEPGSSLFGKAFENWVAHELRCYSQYHAEFWDLTYWGLSSGLEVDFIIGNMEVAIEAKATNRVVADHLKGLRALKQDHPKIKWRYVVCLENKARITDDGIWILPYNEFAKKLWSGEIETE